MTDDVLEFYQQLAQDYHLIYADWHKAIERQGNVLDRLIQARCGMQPADVLDCSCGIGTQAIGLAARGYTVHASDISLAAVERMEQEAAAKGVPLTASVADMRCLDTQISGDFDIVLSCDNALPHLLDDADLTQAVRAMRTKLRPDGLLLISIRDYDHLAENPLRATTPRVFDDDQGRRIVFQVWDWAEDTTTYTVMMFILRDVEGAWQTTTYETTYRALLRAELTEILAAAGYVDIQWHMPQDTGYYQPVVTARVG